MDPISREESADAGINVFLSYSGTDRAIASVFAAAMATRGLKVWFDECDIKAGLDFQAQLESAIRRADAAVVLLGPEVGRWTQAEFRACLVEARARLLRVIPVLLPGAAELREVSLFLATMSAIDLRNGIDDDAVARVTAAAAGSEPLQIACSLVDALNEPVAGEVEPIANQRLDLAAVVSVKHRLHVLSEAVAEEAAREASAVATMLPNDALAVWVPIATTLPWWQAFASTLRLLLGFTGASRKLGSLQIEEIPETTKASGLLSAALEQGLVVVYLDGEPVARVHLGTNDESAPLLRTLNAHGRLGAPRSATATVLERLKAIPIETSEMAHSELALALRRNLEALVPLVASRGIPGFESLTHPENADSASGPERHADG